ncbi:MAG: hypothetical protein EZS28_032665 [Streblomastix strix]|uniref:Uncharacterized protein n=1 Tax=Streblomastix strix TaxID=222440 RepID=A0A5J4UN12_9EUKA|nr:MAG: hypothetical protein EZS28_032665 [Streblomastix strix]
MRLNTALSGRGQRNEFQQFMRANIFQLGSGFGQQAPMNLKVNTGYNTGKTQGANASGGWRRGANLVQNGTQNWSQNGKRIYMLNVQGIKQKGHRPRLEAAGLMATTAPIMTQKQE